MDLNATNSVSLKVFSDLDQMDFLYLATSYSLSLLNWIKLARLPPGPSQASAVQSSSLPHPHLTPLNIHVLARTGAHTHIHTPCSSTLQCLSSGSSLHLDDATILSSLAGFYQTLRRYKISLPPLIPAFARSQFNLFFWILHCHSFLWYVYHGT